MTEFWLFNVIKIYGFIEFVSCVTPTWCKFASSPSIIIVSMNVSLRLTKLILHWCWIGWSFDLKFCDLGIEWPSKEEYFYQNGEEGLKDVPPPDNGGFLYGNGCGGITFNPRNVEDIFAKFFGSSLSGFSSSRPGRSMRF